MLFKFQIIQKPVPWTGFFFLAALLLAGCATTPKGVYESGVASWYGQKFHGKTTASGKLYDMNAMTAAHPRLKFGTLVKVVSQVSGRSVVVKITDRGPFTGGRIIDLSKAAARKLGILRRGHERVFLYLQ